MHIRVMLISIPIIATRICQEALREGVSEKELKKRRCKKMRFKKKRFNIATYH